MEFEDSKGCDDTELQVKEHGKFDVGKACDPPENPPKEHRIPSLVLRYLTLQYLVHMASKSTKVKKCIHTRRWS